MLELPLVFLGGLLGSAHCLGMCGPLALTVGLTTGGAATNLRRQLLFSIGRIFTYSFLGAVAGFLGLWLAQQPRTVVNVQAALAVLAGVVLIVMGLVTAGFLPRRLTSWLSTGPCGSGQWLKTFLTAPGTANIFLAGVFTGAIPCGLVYGFLALAASQRDMVLGGATMACFGLGTVPLMVATGCGGSLLSVATRARVFRIAAFCVILTGTISVARGVAFFSPAGNAPAENCPFCIER